MLPRPVRLIAHAAALLTGCFLQSIVGRVIIVASLADEVNEILACTCIVDGEIITSTAYLVSGFGL